MPEMQFVVRWPDGTEASYYSPSLVMHDYLVAGSSYAVGDFVDRANEALDLASERVRAKYGFACTSAMQTVEEIRAAAASHPGGHDVVVVSMEPPLEGAGA